MGVVGVNSLIQKLGKKLGEGTYFENGNNGMFESTCRERGFIM